MSCGTLLSPERRETDDFTQQILPARDVPIDALPAMNYFNREAWQRDPETYRSFLIWFFETFFEEHSTKQIEDAIGWGLETDGTTLAATHLGPQLDPDRTRELCARIRCPTPRDPRNRRPDHAVRGGRSPGRGAGNAPRGGSTARATGRWCESRCR